MLGLYGESSQPAGALSPDRVTPLPLIVFTEQGPSISVGHLDAYLDANGFLPEMATITSLRSTSTPARNYTVYIR